MKFEHLKNSMDSQFANIQKNTIDNDYLLDSIELILNNTYELVQQMENKRVKPHTPVFNALMELCKSVVNDNYGINECPNTKQIEKYFNEYGLDYKTFLSPLVAMVENERKEN